MSLAKYNFNQSELTAVIENNQPMFVAKDVCKILGIGNVRDAMTRLDADERVSVVVDTLGGKQKVNGVNESGLYGLIFQSRKPIAREFRKWVTSEVLPQIRKQGGYIAPTATPDQLANLQAQLHNAIIEANHYKRLAEIESEAVEIWKSKYEYGQISESNHLPKLLKRRGAWVADPRFRNSVMPNVHQMTFMFQESK